MTVTDKIEARDLSGGERFRLGGTMYVVADTDTNEFGGVIIHFYPAGARSVEELNVLIIDAGALIKIYIDQ